MMNRTGGAYDSHIGMSNRSRHGLPLRRHRHVLAAAVMVVASALRIATTAAIAHSRLAKRVVLLLESRERQ